jgi:tetratricopeptide (TPR) repeat protein
MMQLWEKIMKIISCWKSRKAKTMQMVWIKKGIALDNNGKHREAIAYYDMVLTMDLKHPLAWGFKGAALLNLGKLREAKEAYQNLIKFAPPKYAEYASESRNIVKKIEARLAERREVKGCRGKLDL